jgi:hypothetical protein
MIFQSGALPDSTVPNADPQIEIVVWQPPALARFDVFSIGVSKRDDSHSATEMLFFLEKIEL